MFSLCRNLYKWVKKRRERNATIIVLGLDNAGKSTLLYGLKNELPRDDIIPTMGFSSSKLVSGKYTIQYFDVGGAKNFRNVWKNYYAEVHGVIYVVDAADSDRLEESRETLSKALASEGIPGKPILVFANKQDLAGCLSSAEISEKLGLTDCKSNRYTVAPCQARPAEGQPLDARIGKSLQWLLDSIDNDYARLSERVARDMEEAKRREKERKEEQKRRAEASKAARLQEQAEREAQEKAAAANAPPPHDDHAAAPAAPAAAAAAAAAAEPPRGSTPPAARGSNRVAPEPTPEQPLPPPPQPTTGSEGGGTEAGEATTADAGGPRAAAGLTVGTEPA